MILIKPLVSCLLVVGYFLEDIKLNIQMQTMYQTSTQRSS